MSPAIEDRILDAVQARHMSKAEVRERIVAAVPFLRHVRATSKMSLRAIIKEFAGMASAEDAQRFLQSIDSSSSEDDPYLKGIVTRRQETASMSVAQLASALTAVDWNANVQLLLAQSDRMKQIAECNYRLAVWSSQFEAIYSGNAALCFIRAMQTAAHHVAALTALALYMSVRSYFSSL